MSEPRVSCLLCGQATDVVLDRLWDDRFGASGAFAVARCRACGTEQTVPRLSADALRGLYERHYNFGADRGDGSGYDGLRERLFASPLYRVWLAIDGDISFHAASAPAGVHPRLLDVGCNEGRGLDRYRANGFEVEGLEVNRIAADAARARGFAVHAGPIEEFAPARPFQIAVLSNVLEHAVDPRAMLRAARRILAPGGEVWISLPNAASVIRALLGRRWINWHVPYHVVHFSPLTLRRLLESEGFRIVRMRSITPALWLVQSAVTALFARPGRPTRALRRTAAIAVGTLAARIALFPLLWLANRRLRGDALIVRARRID